MNLNWDSLLEPIFLFILSLIAGTLWVIIPNPRQHAQPHVQIPPQATAKTLTLNTVALKRVATAPPAPLVAQVSGLKKASAELGTVVKELQEQSQLSKQQIEQLQAENQRALDQIESERKTLEKLKAQVQALESQHVGPQGPGNHTAKPSKEVMAETEALGKLLAEKEGEAVRLQAQLDTTKARPESEIIRVPTATPANKLPVLLELIHNRAVPFNKEFYHSKLSLLGPTVSERRSEGETIAEIHDPDSAFNEMLNKIRPEKQYISCLLNADSFPIFREVRRLVQAKHIDLGWEPMDTSSGILTVFPVHIIKKVDKHPKENLPRVPPIMR